MPGDSEGVSDGGVETGKAVDEEGQKYTNPEGPVWVQLSSYMPSFHPDNYSNNEFYHSLFFFKRTMQHAGSLLADQGSNPSPLQWKRRVLTTGPPGKSFHSHF